MRRDLIQEVQKRLERGEAFALATVVRTRGSVPGKLGFQMLVRADGSQLGTVGGAGLEQAVHAACMKALRSGQCETLHYDLNPQIDGGLDSLCGGSSEVFVHAVKKKPHILLAGGGHVAFEVARLCDQLDYLYSVLDDREEYAAAERFPTARGHYLLAPEELEGRLDPSGFTHVLIAGYDHNKDFEVVRWLLPRFHGHLASIGSLRRRKQFDKKLLEAGFAEKQIAAIECPVGLPIGAETPAEIAVSILAGFIQRAAGMPE